MRRVAAVVLLAAAACGRIDFAQRPRDATGAFSDAVSFGGPTLTSIGLLDTFLIRLDPVLVRP